MGDAGLFHLWESETYLIGSAALPVSATALAGLAARRIYDEVLRLTGTHHHLCRIWNYVPDINSIGGDGLEVYQSFCRGRSLAFESAWGCKFKTRLPAASAVGCGDDKLIVLFAASRNQPSHFENPFQIPAYNYPCEYGPRPPSFARASVTRTADGRLDVYVSGTSSVRGHRSIAVGDTASQVLCTLENLRDISQASGLGERCGIDRADVAHIKIYLRHPEELATVGPILQNQFSGKDLRIYAVQADVCRTNLNIEIEVTARGVRAAQ